MNCTKCIHYEMCKYVDSLLTIQEQFPFVADISCKYLEKGEKKPKEIKKANIKTPDIQVSRETFNTPTTDTEDEKDFSSLDINIVFDSETDIIDALTEHGCHIVSDIYALKKKDLDIKIVDKINAKLQIFNQPIILK